MQINRKFFFDQVRKHPFAGPLTAPQVAGLTAILDMWQANHAADDERWLAYMLATAYHETGKRMQPIKEFGGDARADKLYGPAPVGQNPGLAKRLGNTVKGDGSLFIGRGFVQLTGRANYTAWAGHLTLDLVNNPDLALDLTAALRILDYGMVHGTFTGKRLAQYFNSTTEDWIGARRIINGQDKAANIADYGHAFYAAISHVP